MPETIRPVYYPDETELSPATVRERAKAIADDLNRVLADLLIGEHSIDVEDTE